MTLALLFLAAAASAAAADAGRPPLFFREDFKETPAATPITQEHLGNAKLAISLYGPGREGMKKSHHDTPADDPFYVWDGTCAGNCAITLKDRASTVDLTGQAKIRWRTKQSGFRRLHLVVKLANGDWLVSQPLESDSTDWRESEWAISDLKWRKLDIKTMIEAAPVASPDLSRVDEIGWTSMMTGGGTPASTRVDWIEVWGKPAARAK
jgi:hypothetical protein